MLKWEDLSEVEQLATTYSDLHKDAYGFRPRHTAGWLAHSYREAIADIRSSIDRQKETFAGREQLREDGWFIDETDPKLQQQAIWLAEERDRLKKEHYGDLWEDCIAEAPKLRRAWLEQAA